MTQAKTDPVLLHRSGDVCVLTLNRPEKRNSANYDMQRLILEALQEVGRDPGVRALVLAGAGPSFCAGGDLSDLEAAGEGRLPDMEAWGRMQLEMMRALLEFPFPAIAAVQGAAAGFGAALAASCDIVVAAEDAMFWDPHVKYGVPASLILQLVWPRLTSLAVARDLLMTGRKVGGAEAVGLGLAGRLCARGEALSTALQVAEDFARMPPGGLATMKRGFNRAILRDLTEYRSL